MARIVVIEDNSANLELMEYLLSVHGYTPEGYRDGQSGYDAVRGAPPDLVLSDIELPKMSGLEIARRLREEPRFRRLPLIGVTALAMRGDAEKVLAAGFDGYISKPIDPVTFVGQVGSFLPEPLRKNEASPAAGLADSSVPIAVMPGAGAKTLLVVDDTLANLDLMRTILEYGGYRVLAAAGIEDALNVLRSERVDLVLSDVHMPDGSGFDLCRAVTREKAASPVPFVFISSTNVGVDDRAKAAELGVDQILERPIEAERLLAILRRRVPARATRATPRALRADPKRDRNEDP